MDLPVQVEEDMAHHQLLGMEDMRVVVAWNMVVEDMMMDNLDMVA